MVAADRQLGTEHANSARNRELTMRDLVDDWRKWSFPERLLAAVLVLTLIGLPLRALIAATPL
jgi:hypothetical protein